MTERGLKLVNPLPLRFIAEKKKLALFFQAPTNLRFHFLGYLNLSRVRQNFKGPGSELRGKVADDCEVKFDCVVILFVPNAVSKR